MSHSSSFSFHVIFLSTLFIAPIPLPLEASQKHRPRLLLLNEIIVIKALNFSSHSFSSSTTFRTTKIGFPSQRFPAKVYFT